MLIEKRINIDTLFEEIPIPTSLKKFVNQALLLDLREQIFSGDMYTEMEFYTTKKKIECVLFWAVYYYPDIMLELTPSELMARFSDMVKSKFAYDKIEDLIKYDRIEEWELDE